jgi:hypothetical protein
MVFLCIRQKAVAKYGFRKSKIKATMICQLEQCWVALNPPKAPAKPRKAPAKANKTTATTVKARATSPADSATSEEVPLADQDGAKKTKKKKEKVVKPPPMTVEQLYQVFQSMLIGDNEVYSRLLRYEVSLHRGYPVEKLN